MPLPPSNVIASEVTASSVKLAWSRPRQKRVSQSRHPDRDGAVGADSPHPEPGPSFVLQYARKISPASEPASDADYLELGDVGRETEYTVRGLQPNTVYEFRVASVGSVGRGQPSKPIEVTTSELGQ